MKRKPEPATAGDEDPETGEVIVGTEHSASISESPEDKPERRKKWRRSSSDFHNDCTSKYLGSVLDVIIEAKKGEMLSIVAGKHDDNGEVWKECEKLGFKYRAFYTEDETIIEDSKPQIEREIQLSKEGGDLEHEDPNFIIAQRTYSPYGNTRLKAHQLYFRGPVDLDRPYIFPKLGDEILGAGCPDLHLTFRGIGDWDTVVRGARFASCDRNVRIEVTAGDVESGRQITFDVEQYKIVEGNLKPKVGVLISCADFKPLYDGLSASAKESSDAYTSTSSKKRKTHERESGPKRSLEDSRLKTIAIKLIGMGPAVDPVLRADINLNLVLRC